MIVENRGQQQSIRYVIDTDRCCGCKKCIRRCMENVWQWDEEKKYAYPKYPDECVLCYQCEMDCLNNVIDSGYFRSSGGSVGIQCGTDEEAGRVGGRDNGRYQRLW